uniref:NR LBD domain-containing protein n=1 Tax=Acrobeloides nanus TaxID=290746 RepID=A0A914C6E1_9BILA
MYKANNIIEMFQRFIEHTPIVPIEILEELYIRILEPLKRINLTEKEYVLLKTLIYCYNALTDLSEYARSILQKQADKYSQLLLRYLQLEHGEIKGAQKYAEVISLMGTFFAIAEKHRQVFLLQRLTRECIRKEIYMNQRPKLVEEIMHLK